MHTNETRLMYARQKNYRVSLIRKRQNEFYGNLDVKDVIDNKKN